MIFVTVGTDLPFNRLVRVVDEWAREAGRSDVFAQIGQTDWKPSFVPYTHFLEPADFTRYLSSASAIVSHAGMGTILSALRWEKPILVMPRRASMGEQRNEHQLATARRLLEMKKVTVAFDENELREKIAELETLRPQEKIGPFASQELISTISSFIRRT